MCEIFFMKNPNGEITTGNLISLLYTAVKEASQRNSDGFGLFNEDRLVYKSPEKLGYNDISDLVELYKGSEFVVIHLRMATQGAVEKRNSHPFKHKSNVLVHNGTVDTNRCYMAGRADSYQLLRDIYKRKDGDTVKAIQDSLGKTTGSVSVFLYDYKDRLYYFRETSRFTFGKLDSTGEIVGATVGNRLVSAFGYDDIHALHPEESTVYQVTDSVDEVTDFEMGIHGIGKRDNVYNGFYSQYDSDYKKKDLEDEYQMERYHRGKYRY